MQTLKILQMFNNKRNQINPRSCTLKFPGDKFLSQYDRFGVSIIKDKVPYFYRFYLEILLGPLLFTLDLYTTDKITLIYMKFYWSFDTFAV